MLDVYNQPWYLEAVCPTYRTHRHDGITFNYHINDRGEASSPYGYAGIHGSSPEQQSRDVATIRRSIGLPLFIRHSVHSGRPDGPGVSSRNTCVIPTSDPWTDQNRDALREIKRAERLGIKAQIRSSEAKALEDFRDGYRSAMQRKGAADKHYALADRINSWAGIDEVCVISTEHASALFLVDCDGWAHYHLAYRDDQAHGTESYAIFAAITPWLGSLGVERIHLGGGMTNDPQDPLYRFKAKIGRIPHQVFFQEIP